MSCLVDELSCSPFKNVTFLFAFFPRVKRNFVKFDYDGVILSFDKDHYCRIYRSFGSCAYVLGENM